MKSLFDQIQKSLVLNSFVRSVITLMTGTAIAQAIPFLIAPILSRVYTPADFGGLAVFLSLASIGSVVATGQYSVAIVLPEQDEEAINLVVLSLELTAAVSISILIVLTIFNSELSAFLQHREIVSLFYLIPCSVALAGIYQTLNFWFNRHEQYGKLANGRICQSLSTAGLNIVAGLSGWGGTGLIISTIVGQAIATAYFVWLFWWSDREKLSLVRQYKILRLLKEYQNFPKFNTPQAFFDNLRNSGIILLISYYFNPVILGYYSFTLKVIQTPLNLIASAISQVFYKKVAEVHNANKGIWRLSKKLIFAQICMGFPLLLLIGKFAPALFAWCFGKEWFGAGIYAQILIVWLLISFISSPLSIIPVVLEKQKTFFFIAFGYNFLLPASVFVCSYLTRQIEPALWGITILGGGYLMMILMWTRSIARFNDEIVSGKAVV